MKRTYETPTAEKIAFCYEEQVAASTDCISTWINQGVGSCDTGTPTLWEQKNS